MHVIEERDYLFFAKPLENSLFSPLRHLGPFYLVCRHPGIAEFLMGQDKCFKHLLNLTSNSIMKDTRTELFLERGQLPARPRQKLSEEQH